MSKIDLRSVFSELVSEASRAPSVHNVQPARWRLRESGQIELLADPSRQLKIGDPTGHDHRISLGNSLEGMRLALSKRGLQFADLEISKDHLTEIASFKAVPGVTEDPRARWVSQRVSYRGKFFPAQEERLTELRLRMQADPLLRGHLLVSDPKLLKELSELSDDASYEFMSQRPYLEELNQWLRLSRSHPHWNRDGLNADSMALSTPERWAASVLLAPSVFEILKTIRLGKMIASEKPKTDTASAMLILTAPQGEDWLDTGKRFYGAWLELAAAGLSACPISALADSRSANDWIRKRLDVSESLRIFSVFRVGVAPSQGALALSPRLPVSELIFNSSSA